MIPPDFCLFEAALAPMVGFTPCSLKQSMRPAEFPGFLDNLISSTHRSFQNAVSTRGFTSIYEVLVSRFLSICIFRLPRWLQLQHPLPSSRTRWQAFRTARSAVWKEFTTYLQLTLLQLISSLSLHTLKDSRDQTVTKLLTTPLAKKEKKSPKLSSRSLPVPESPNSFPRTHSTRREISPLLSICTKTPRDLASCTSLLEEVHDLQLSTSGIATLQTSSEPQGRLSCTFSSSTRRCCGPCSPGAWKR